MLDSVDDWLWEASRGMAAAIFAKTHFLLVAFKKPPQNPLCFQYAAQSVPSGATIQEAQKLNLMLLFEERSHFETLRSTLFDALQR